MRVDTVTEQQQQPQRRRALSGIKPTATPHLGNHLGMILPAIALQESHEVYYFVADYHALTTLHDAELMRRYSYEIAAYFLAFGLDPQRAVFFRQSDVPEVAELSWLLSCVTSMGLLERAHAWKAARDRGEEGASPHGLFAYPVLMAADILLYDSDAVPVGKDQVQHLEMTRDIAERFNHVFGETFKLPRALVRDEVATVTGLDGRKMSKSYGNTITLVEPPKSMKKKLMSIVTDSTPMEEPKDPDTCNVFALYKLFATPDKAAALAERYRTDTTFGYGHAKLALFEEIEAHVGPARERYHGLLARQDELEDLLRDGARRARETARPVLDRARQAVGFRPQGH